MSVDADESSARTPAVAVALEALATRGYAVVTGCVSRTLTDKVLRGHVGRMSYEHVRRFWDGLPAFLCERSIGTCVFSALTRLPAERAGHQGAWHRGRGDTVASGAPRDFIPGFDLVVPLEAGLEVLVLPASGRQLRDEPVDFESARAVPLAVEDLMILDSRLYRRFRGAAQIVILSVVRDWIDPIEIQTDGIASTTPARAAAFFGRELLARTDMRDWLLATRS